MLLLLVLCSCTVGDFAPERVALHNQGHPDCNVTPEKCIDGVAW